MKNKTKHLYIHIPYCKDICHYCDFYRFKSNDQIKMNQYIKRIIQEIKKTESTFDSIYIGGGTPNYLSTKTLKQLLLSLQKNLNKKTEFTIECNPELISEEQVKLFVENKVNRISLGVQTLNEKILILLNRKHKNIDVIKALDLFKKYKLNNISCDFIYNLPLMRKQDVIDVIEFIQKHQIKHISWYALELKENSFLNQSKYKLDKDLEYDFSDQIILELNKIKLTRYEISNWCKYKKYQSKHNLCYWKLNNWKGIGNGAYGFENNNYYLIKSSQNKFIKENNIWDLNEILLNKLIMGLRIVEGISLKNKINKQAYLKYFETIKDETIVENEKLKAKDIDNLNELLLKLI